MPRFWELRFSGGCGRPCVHDDGAFYLEFRQIPPRISERPSQVRELQKPWTLRTTRHFQQQTATAQAGQEKEASTQHHWKFELDPLAQLQPRV